MPTTYHLPPHVFSCLAGRYCVFLDLKRDRYFSVPQNLMIELAPWMEGWEHRPCSRPPADAQVSESAAELALELLAAGVVGEGPLDEDPMDEADRTSATPAPDCDLLSMELPDGREDQAPSGPAAVALSLLYAEWALRTMPIARIVETVRKGKPSRAPFRSADCEATIRLAMTFLKYRPFFPRDFRCLFDSLALIRFLSRFRLYPDWVFGVQDDPFSAHCWVQAGTRVLNDHLDRVSTYTRIMIV